MYRRFVFAGSLGTILIILLSGCHQAFSQAHNALPEVVQTWGGLSNGISSATFSPESKILVLQHDNSLDIIDTTDWHQEQTLSISDPWGVQFSPDGKWLWANADPGSFRWDTKTWNVTQQSTGKNSTLLLPDGRVLLYNDTKATVETGNKKVSVPNYSSWSNIQGITSSPDGKMIAVGGLNEIEFIDTKSWRVIKTLTGYWIGTNSLPDRVISMCFSPNGKLFAAGGTNSCLKVWHTHPWGLAYTLLNHDGVETIDFSSDSKLLLTTQGDVQIWNANSGTILGSLNIVRAPDVEFANFSPNGKYLLTGREDQTVNVWTVASVLSMKK